MIRRPKPGEDESDILKMQEEFLKEKSKNQNLQPAAQVVNLRSNESTKRPNSDSGDRKPSKYAQSKGLKGQAKKRVKINDTPTVIGEVLEKNTEDSEKGTSEVEDDKVYYPKVIPFILGNIIEKNTDAALDIEFKPLPSDGFPVVTKRDPTIVPGKRSIHAQSIEKDKNKSTIEMETEETAGTSSTELNKINLPSKSYILTSQEADQIHNENINLLSKMSEEQILEEKVKLLSNLSPNLVEYIKSKRKQSNIQSDIEPETMHTNETTNKPDLLQKNEPADEIMDTTEPKSGNFDSLWENDVLSHPEVTKWLHFDTLEKDKLEWIRGIEESKKIKPDEEYEARFDFQGYLMPYAMEYTESTKSLFQHGDEPHRPGYTLSELIELSRSSITQQRVMALNTIAGILEYNSVGTYKGILEIPLTKVFFTIRYAIDENKVILLEPALKAMRNLIFNRIDEASLDALMGFEEGMNQPFLKNDKSEIDDLETKESELKDFHLAEIDIITALLRMDILQRLYYIIETVKPTFNCVQYCLQILTRLARDSNETASKIIEAVHLMEAIVRYFVPSTGINFVFDPKIVYNGKPILAALKLLRVLSLQSKEISELLINKFDMLKPISDYISSAVDRSYGLRIQIEAYLIFSNLLKHRLCIESAVSLSPVILTSLYKHVQGTNIHVTESVLSGTHAAVILQLLNNLMSCTYDGYENILSQMYPLLKDGVNKWLIQLSQSSNYTCAHLRPLCAALDSFRTVIPVQSVPMKFLNDDLTMLSSSKIFKNMVNNLVFSSNLLSNIENKNLYFVKNLVSLRSSVIDSAQKVLPTLNVISPIPFLESLFKLLVVLNNKELSEVYLKLFVSYTVKLAKNFPSLCENWFTRMEVDLVFNIITLALQNEMSETDKDLLYAVANKLCYILRTDKKYELEFLFNNVVFNKNWFTVDRLLHVINLSEADGFSKALTSIEDIQQCYSTVINVNFKEISQNVVLNKWMEPILPRDWIYLPILMLYSKSQEPQEALKVAGEHAKKLEKKRIVENKFVIICSLKWIVFNELCFPDLLNDIDITDRFCRLMCVFLCDNSLFLEANIKILLQKCTNILFKKKSGLNFDKELTGLNNFQDLYTQFLEQFQSVSYGDYTFAACVLVPLAQHHNVKWRKLLWSEYAGCLRALDCPEEYLCYNFSDYLYPEENDESLIKSYFQAISSNLLRPNTIVHRIAVHHVNSFKNRKGSINIM